MGANRPLSYMPPAGVCLLNGVKESLSVSGYHEPAYVGSPLVGSP